MHFHCVDQSKDISETDYLRKVRLDYLNLSVSVKNFELSQTGLDTILRKSKESYIYLNEAKFSQTSAKKNRGPGKAESPESPILNRRLIAAQSKCIKDAEATNCKLDVA